MVVSLQTRMRIVFVAFIIVGLSLLEVDAFVYPLAIDKLNEPLFKKQHSINGGGSNESVVSGEVINHVRHQHEQTIGNVHILTNIDIANLITILNVSAPAPTTAATAVAGQSTDATTQPGWAKNNNSNRNEITSNGGYEPFRRLERNRGVDYKPFKFPTLSTVSENSRRVRWPTERHSVHAIDIETVVNPMAIIVFPRSESNRDNKLPVVESAEIATASTQTSTAFQSNKMNESNESTVAPLMPNSVNVSAFVVNQTAIENEFEPLIYIDDDGFFQVKYVPKGENVSLSNAVQQPILASINKTEGVAIISNDNRQIPLGQHIQNETNTVSSPPTPTTTAKATTTSQATTIGLIHDQAINNTEAIFESHDVHTESTSSKPDQQKQQQQQQPVPASKHPSLFNELPIFA